MSIHGTTTGYWRGCRCDRCRAAHATAAREQAHRRRHNEPLPHGSQARYGQGCRCRLCVLERAYRETEVRV